jgi:hypothetical protein
MCQEESPRETDGGGDTVEGKGGKVLENIFSYLWRLQGNGTKPKLERWEPRQSWDRDIR